MQLAYGIQSDGSTSMTIHGQGFQENLSYTLNVIDRHSVVCGGGCEMGWIVRRLTPVECERLQGFPDGWTDLHGKVKTNKDGTTTLVEGETSDSARYKALGNSMAVPVMKWIGERIVRVSVSQSGGEL